MRDHRSREISSLRFAASSSRRPWRRRRQHVRYSQGRPVSLRRRRGPALPPRPANPRSPDLPLGLGPPRAPPAPPRRRRPPARPSVHLQQAVPSTVRPRGAGRARGLGSCSLAEGSAAAEEAALSLEGRGSYRGGGGGGSGGSA
ncbi:hypothetical protein J1605_014693 [Eschrichtius robustus]|uniref:Uncharacterized protein n=1 Tax=Eschrichtius robustus TaxID=9764 RepID=A0AB34GEU4_ESCRO|nr:hypothetical protein J1605_014693 [Eschrichtius robustus]